VTLVCKEIFQEKLFHVALLNNFNLDIDECDNDPCTEDGAVCTNTLGSYTCSCPEELYNNGNLCYGMRTKLTRDIRVLFAVIIGVT
jgi:hypothetical protein